MTFLPGFFGLQTLVTVLSTSTLSLAVPWLTFTALGSPLEQVRLDSGE